MLKITENRSSFADDEIVKIVKRENNSKRNYLLVNSTQGKHVPADPQRVLKLFSELAQQIKPVCENKNVLFIGFAETATAVGTAVASCFDGSYYVHTTREKNDKLSLVAEFREEHSHATEQLLYCNDWDNISSWADIIVFVEDEITTGKTIMNFIKELTLNKKVSGNKKFIACSIINGMTDERKSELLSDGLECFYLMKLNASASSDEVYTYTEATFSSDDADYEAVSFSGYTDPRAGVLTEKYIKACDTLADSIFNEYDFDGMDVAVIGTEECMYPAIRTADFILENSLANSVVTHSTTRSPIVAENIDSYPLKTRYQVESLYDDSRKTYIYNSDLKLYDIVLVITDSQRDEIKINRLANAFSGYRKFILVKWGDG